jgi:hypothetical protein
MQRPYGGGIRLLHSTVRSGAVNAVGCRGRGQAGAADRQGLLPERSLHRRLSHLPPSIAREVGVHGHGDLNARLAHAGAVGDQVWHIPICGCAACGAAAMWRAEVAGLMSGADAGAARAPGAGEWRAPDGAARPLRVALAENSRERRFREAARYRRPRWTPGSPPVSLMPHSRQLSLYG